MNSEKNARGNVGKSSAGDRVKRLYHQAHPKFKMNKDLTEKIYLKPTMSLKAFARQLVKDENADAKDWFDSKAGALEVGRSEKNKTRVTLEASATKLAKKAKKK